MFWRLTLFHSHLLLFQSSTFLLSLLMTESLPKGSWREFTPFRKVTSLSWCPSPLCETVPESGPEPFNVDLENRYTNKCLNIFQ